MAATTTRSVSAHSGQFGNDRTSFLGSRIPLAVETMAKSLKDLDKEIFRKTLKAVVNAIEGKDCRELMRNISENAKLSEEQLSFIISGMYTLLREALRLPTSTLKQEVQMPFCLFNTVPFMIQEEFIADFASVIFGNRRSVLEAATLQQGTRLPAILDFKWRVDVAISTSSLARSLQPSIMVQMKLSDGRVQCFEIPVSKFQELRYNVALILKEMNDLEKRSVLKIQD
ncbi:COMM domain-containing protein 5 isoform X1 [Latimeria chalumnae]|uniref:COMM domain-containing protein 5 isoform X1 n=1 Tax=Latimeria chalumnae TaxID=7897 RepID=UPI0006D9333F|nr:PREDICTED: COMM domain-containing protein 5 isoform X1 [Latimeria chalumnae]XP_014348690.1 PREDICTED: COMM domain-containing protein 5 isoform X1 [Latimeria chalumnae]XP_014348691.1 PREDICTED: COMM domain-containing protein 5 isoform X1 [Latimeria chalumnae]XP_014348692.1 PREDICTED: COMM domain-containing protein 5 isoform X1 [Latimeria chalumnae]XP_014348693.1 PREDICTED: COMM domain-containing protein 5 isoform X1 [Latimeria chalumnae]|eukprot:XP_014348689.1 PREDICTED: COMM domain-containing protein 5 isoform X1 [Latimeria chalumnae]